MKLDLSYSSQCLDIKTEMREAFLGQVHRILQKGYGVRLIAPVTVFGVGLIQLTTRIGNIAELILKGIINILGAPCFNQCNASRGLLQIGITIPLSLLNGIFELSMVIPRMVYFTIEPEQFVYYVQRQVKI